MENAWWSNFSCQRIYQSDFQPDLIISTDMLDLTTFLSLTRSKTADIPIVLYFHENQITYPWSSNDRDVMEKRDIHYGFINIASALAADQYYLIHNFTWILFYPVEKRY